MCPIKLPLFNINKYGQKEWIVLVHNSYHSFVEYKDAFNFYITSLIKHCKGR